MPFSLSGALSGLSAEYPGYQKGRLTEDQIQVSDVAAQDAKRSALAKVAMGNALQMLASGSGGQGNTSNVGPQAQPPMPGQPSQPMMRPGQQPPMGGAPGGGMPPPGGMPQGMPPRPMMPQGGAPGMPPGGMPRPPMPGGAPGPPMQLGQPGGMPGGGQGGGQGGALDWRQLVAAVKQANPNLPPDVIAEAVNQFLPMMSQQSKQEWQGISLQIREQALQQREQQFLIAEQGRNSRNEENVAGREDIASGNRQSRETIANTQSQDRAAALGERKSEFQQREQRLEDALKFREDSTYQRLDQQKQAAIQRVQESKGKQGLAEARALLDQQDKHVRTRIQAYSSANTLKPAERKALLDQADKDYNTGLEQLRAAAGRSTPTGGTSATPQPKTDDRAPSGSPGQPPPEALQALKEGMVTTFQNGQKWTLKDGKPEQVK